MSSSQRHILALLLLTGGSLLWADEPQPPVVPLSADEVLEKKILGKATVEFVAGEVNELNIDSVFMPGKGHAQIIKAKTPGAKGEGEFLVVITRDVATALLKSGVTEVTEHFRNKQIRVTGTIARVEGSDRRPPGPTMYRLQVSNLEQLERVKAAD